MGMSGIDKIPAYHHPNFPAQPEQTFTFTEHEFKFKPGDKVMLRPRGHPSHPVHAGNCNDPAWIEYYSSLLGKIRTVKTASDTSITLEEDPPNCSRSSVRFELVKYTPEKYLFKAGDKFQVGDKVVLRDRNHPNHENWYPASLLDIANKTLTVKEVSVAHLKFAEPTASGGWFRASRFELSARHVQAPRRSGPCLFKAGDKIVEPEQIFTLQKIKGSKRWFVNGKPLTDEEFNERMNREHNKFQVGDKVVLRPEGHPGHNNVWFQSVHGPMLDKIFTVESLAGVSRSRAEAVLTVNGDIKLEGMPGFFWDSRFEIVNVVDLARAYDLSIPKNYVWIENCYKEQAQTRIQILLKGNPVRYITTGPAISTSLQMHRTRIVLGTCVGLYDMNPNWKIATEKIKSLSSPNQVYINHIYERLVQNITPNELISLAERLDRAGKGISL